MWGRLVEGAQKGDTITKRYPQRSGFQVTGLKDRKGKWEVLRIRSWWGSAIEESGGEGDRKSEMAGNLSLLPDH